MSASVKVAVRVRPFNDREINLHSQCVIDVVGNKTRLLNFKPQADDNSEAKEFTFDYSYWSHDHKSHHFASQEKVYNDLGSSVVSSGLQGYNACVFAYGQTGSGKTFTMMGSQSNPGLIPRICKALFSSMEKGTESGTTYKVEVSYLEIYNERVKDLLCAHPARDEHLKVREHKKFGPYVENLSKHIVTQYSDVQDLMQRGNSVRTTASTNMNDTSSRSHAIFTLTFVQAKLLADLPVETRSKINLVDLAGSERADATGATGQRLKEGSHINKSLVTLGTVISALADQGAKCNKKVHIPYRDSVLTFLLKDSLGGNSKTIMIATISPADVNFGETLGTLRYANRAKNIINTPTVNEDQNVKLIRELREEIAMLKKLAGGDANTGLPGVGESFTRSGDVSIRATLSLKEAQEKELTDKWTEKWRQTHKILQEQRTLELRQAGESGRGVVLDSERPHLLLYDDDLGSTGLILFHLNDELTTIGASEDQDIRIEGLGLEKEHCSIRLQGDGAVLETKEDAEVKVNDRLVEDKVELSHGAMIVVGSSHVFRYNDPKEAARIRKQGNRSSMNLSRLSFLSRSNTDLLRATDANANLGMPDLTFKGLESERRAMDDSSIPRPFTELSPECCEMSTQTSLPSYTRVGQDSMAPPWGGPPRPPDGSPRSNVSRLCPERFSAGVSLLSSADSLSDTYYSATSNISDMGGSGSLNDLIPSCQDVNSIASPIRRVGDALLPSPGAAAGAATSTPKQEIRRIMGILDGPGNGCRPKKALEEHFKGSSDPVSQFANETRRSTDSNRIAESETSDLLPISSDLLRLNEVLVRLHSEDALANKSAEQQKKELKELQNYYTALENKILESQGQALPMTLDNRSHLTSEKWSSDLPLEVLLKEEKVVLLIESEVQRRLMDNMLRLSHKGTGTVNKGSDGGQGHDPMQRSSSASSLSFARTLSFNELRPYSSSSDIAPGDSQATTTPSSSLVPHVFPAHCRPSSSTQYSETDPEANSGIPYFIRIPFFELRGEGADAHCVYQVEVSVGDDVWCVFRRFRKFRELHLSMGRRHGAAVQDLYFPPRRIFGNHSLSVVQQRRKELESYLRQLVSLCSEMEGSPLCDHPPSRARLEEFSPFFCEALTDLRGQKL